MNVGAACFNTNLAQYRERGVSHELVFLIRQGLSGCYRNRVTGVDAHGIEILNRTNDDAVVVLVSNDLHLKLFPTNERFIDKQLIGWRQFETALTNGLELHSVVSNTAAGATHGKGRANDARETDLLENTKRFL